MIIDVLLSFVGSKFHVHCTIDHRLIYGVDAWYTSSTTTNECEVHLYHLFVALLPRYQAAQQRPKWPIGPIAWPRLFWAGPKWPIGPMLWPTCVEFVPCDIAVHSRNSGTTGVLLITSFHISHVYHNLRLVVHYNINYNHHIPVKYLILSIYNCLCCVMSACY